ncbi:hypothetical protein FISHEDRAFT_41224 [Fistulina hepatica ATCC 64428]|nr:hypothetical protein FISHEDRAFT_41224 [Fistulina hepatica ATCC 64428]
MTEEPAWKKLKLSLERPYKDENGNPIPVLLDITPDGQHIYEPKLEKSDIINQNLEHIRVEHGPERDFFRRFTQTSELLNDTEVVPSTENTKYDARPAEKGVSDQASMSSEELAKMRSQLLPQLMTALGEMTTARDLLSVILQSVPSTSTSTQPAPSQPHVQVVPAPPTSDYLANTRLSTTIISNPPPIISVEAFNAQVAIGGKDEALRKAANAFRVASQSMERSRARDEQYWLDALRIRKANWGLVPAALPPGSATGKGADKTSKDFLVSFGLEESPSVFRRRALAKMGNVTQTNSELLSFPGRRNVRLQISLKLPTSPRLLVSSRLSSSPPEDAHDMTNHLLREVQREIVDEEIFSVLVHEAGALPTASARVSERLVVVDVSDGVELGFELVSLLFYVSLEESNVCDLVYHALRVLLLRRHSKSKAERLANKPVSPKPVVSLVSDLLQPTLDLIQYTTFHTRLRSTLNDVTQLLRSIGVESTLRLDYIGEKGVDLVAMLSNTGRTVSVGGEAILRIANQRTIRLTFSSASSLTAHLSQAILPIDSIPQLNQLLQEEIERFLLEKICQSGISIHQSGEGEALGTWFVDLDRCVGRWEGCVL